MNAKKAKQLRKLARGAVDSGIARHLVGVEGATAELKMHGNTVVPSVTAVNNIKSTRGIYRFLKREAGAFRPVDKSKGVKTDG